MKNSRLVYSTESGRICPECGRIAARCRCKKKRAPKQSLVYPDDGIVRIRREVKGRKGKTVTTIWGLPLENPKLQQVAKSLKRKCGTGGTMDGNVIVIQGDHRETLLQELKKQGYAVKVAGG